MERYCQLGRLLDEDTDISDAEVVAEAKVVIAELSKVQAEMDAMLKRRQ
jgi:hypothetical protein